MPSITRETWRNFIIIVILTLVCLFVNLPNQIKLGSFSLQKPDINWLIKKDLGIRYGLDLAGGASLLFDIDTTKTDQSNLTSALDSLKENIERRVNLFGVSESTVQLSESGGKHRLAVEMPGLQDIDTAVDLIGQTAQLEFKGIIELPPEATASASADDYLKTTGLNGSHLVRAQVQINSTNSQPEVSLEFNNEGARLFASATKEFLNQRIAIILDNQIITAPVVQTEILDGKAVINGNFDHQSAKTLAAQLNAGALPLSINPIRQTQVGASLGEDTIQKGTVAGVVGLIAVGLFMIGNYGYLGLIANIGLAIYALITLTLYRLIPVTLTFPGIVGFILSVGMAVDSNILIFERMKEELRHGKPFNIAMELGFGRAWDSIKDANTCTIITGLILFNPFNWSFLNSSGLVRGFAVTLILGIIISIFTGVFITRNLLRVLTHKKLILNKSV